MEVNIHQAKTNLSKLLKQLEEGEDIVIAKSGKPIARLVLLLTPPAPRRIGSAKGDFVVPEDFDDPLPESVLAGFEG